MKTERILLPINVRKFQLEVFSFINGLAPRCNFSVTLLHVITLNILPPESRLYDELAAEARFYLECLAREYLPAASSTSTHIRFGNFTDEVVSQAEAEKADIIVLPGNGLLTVRPIDEHLAAQTRFCDFTIGQKSGWQNQ